MPVIMVEFKRDYDSGLDVHRVLYSQDMGFTWQIYFSNRDRAVVDGVWESIRSEW